MTYSARQRKKFTPLLGLLFILVLTPSVEASTGLGSDDPSGWLRAVIPLMLLSLGGLLSWLSHRRKAQKKAGDPHRSRRQVAARAAPLPLIERSSRAAHFSTGELEVSEATAQVLLSGFAEDAERICPACSRRFDGSITRCPFDETPLESLLKPANQELDLSSRMSCPLCDASFELHASFCPYDGEPLSLTSNQVESLLGRHCPACERVYLEPLSRCPVDHAPLPEVPSPVTPSTLDPEGARICPDCGQRASAQASYCTLDGSSLESLN